MRILLTTPIANRLKRELRAAGRREIGGLLMGEHVADDVFRLVDISVQRSGGSASCFTRDPRDHQRQLDDFFDRHNRDYARFNYLGEWHSHPSFPPYPSSTDIATMQEIVRSPDVAVNFLVLLIVRLRGRSAIEVSATAFPSGREPEAVEIVIEGIEAGAAPQSWLRRLADYLLR